MDAASPAALLHATARRHAARGEDAAAIAALMAVLSRQPHNLAALLELASLAQAGGHRAAAATALRQAVHCHPGDPRPCVGLGDLALVEGDLAAARHAYTTALAADPACALAHQGLARIAAEAGDTTLAAQHAARGFPGHARMPRRHAAPETGPPVLLLVAALGGNIPTEAWLDPRRYAITALHPEYDDPAAPLPAHRLIVNAIGDAERASAALAAAEALCARSPAPVINAPARAAATTRPEIARLAATLSGWRVPAIAAWPRAAPPAAATLTFPLLLRAPGYQTGRHFLRVERAADLPAALAALPGDQVLAMSPFDARGADGRYRKYRVLAIGGRLWPLHLAVADQWKVHYFTAAMTANTPEAAAARAEEARFLADMADVLGPRAMAALGALAAALGLDYAGIDFALGPDGTALLFEANPAMLLPPPDPHPLLAYRRPATEAAIAAMQALLAARMTG